MKNITMASSRNLEGGTCLYTRAARTAKRHAILVTGLLFYTGDRKEDPIRKEVVFDYSKKRNRFSEDIAQRPIREDSRSKDFATGSKKNAAKLRFPLVLLEKGPEVWSTKGGAKPCTSGRSAYPGASASAACLKWGSFHTES